METTTTTGTEKITRRHPRYRILAAALNAARNCEMSGNAEWRDRHRARAEEICKEGPSGSGWDEGTKIDLDASTGEKIVLRGSWHHMNEHGYYDGWTDHAIYVRPSLVFGIELRITGRDRNSVKEYLHVMFYTWLTEEMDAE
jgi:hypothetical protein